MKTRHSVKLIALALTAAAFLGLHSNARAGAGIFGSDDGLKLNGGAFTFYENSLQNDGRHNPLVSGGITLPQTPEDQPRGLQFQGVAEKLTQETDIQTAIALYKDRIFPEAKIRQFMASPANPHDFYRIKPTLFVLFDVANFPENPRQEWNPNA